jgi:hypothetical protein
MKKKFIEIKNKFINFNEVVSVSCDGGGRSFFVLFKNGKEIYIEISSEREYLDFIDCFRGLQN